MVFAAIDEGAERRESSAHADGGKGEGDEGENGFGEKEQGGGGERGVEVIEEVEPCFDEKGADGDDEFEGGVEAEWGFVAVDSFPDRERADGEAGEVGGENGGRGRRGAAEDEREAALPERFVNEGDESGEEKEPGERGVGDGFFGAGISVCGAHVSGRKQAIWGGRKPENKQGQ